MLLTVLASASSSGGEAAIGHRLPFVTLLPFAALLLAIALFPLAAPHWWERNRNKALVAAALAAPIALYLVIAWKGVGVHHLVEKGREYLSFIVLLGALYVISGGTYIRGSFAGTPLVNTVFLAFGALLASVIGTTGASMLLIRPLLRANESRQRVAHVVIFFIFVVANCGGLLTPLGDPPLFLGFLNGVPFEWTFRLLPQWAFVNGALLVIFHVWDQVVLNREERERPGSQLEELLKHEPLRVFGSHNILLLAGVIATIFASGKGLGNAGRPWPFGVQEGLMLLLAVASYLSTRRAVHQAMHFNFGPLIEVAVLFAGIFVTMIPALSILNARAPQLALHEPWHYFWGTGLLSSFLDNAPTYLTFTATAAGTHGVPLEGRYLAVFLSLPETRAHEVLAAISCGAVFMGANTYIGNGPNFMVRAIAEQYNVRMPGFAGYMLYSMCILLPLFGVATVVFFV